MYWSGGLLSNTGTWLQNVAGSIFVYQLTGSALAVGILNFAAFLPILLFSIVGGVLSDRFDRRQLVLVTHAASGLMAAALAALTFAGDATEVHVIIAAFAINTSYAVAKPALSSLIPDLVPREDLTDAIGLNSLQFISGQLIGPLLAAGLIAAGGAGWAFAINAVTYLGPMGVMLYLLRRRLAGNRPTDDGPDPAQASGNSAIEYVKSQPWVLWLLLGITSTSAALEVIRTLAPAVVVEGLGAPESAAGILVAAQSAGSAVGLLLFVPLRRLGLSWRLASVGLLLQASGLIGVALSSSVLPAAVAVGLIGLGFALCFPVLTGALQGGVPNRMRGRVMSYHTLSHLGNRPFAALGVGGFASLIGAHAAVLGGLLLAPIGLLAIRLALRQIGDAEVRSSEKEAPRLADAP